MAPAGVVALVIRCSAVHHRFALSLLTGALTTAGQAER
jgi:hypothetical protein